MATGCLAVSLPAVVGVGAVVASPHWLSGWCNGAIMVQLHRDTFWLVAAVDLLYPFGKQNRA